MSRRYGTTGRLALILAGTLAFPLMARAQAAESSAQPQAPAPDESVMRPTQLGIRLTPDMAIGLGRLWMQDDPWRDANLSDEQERAVADAVAYRMMELAHRDGAQGRESMEYLLELGITKQMRVNADNCKEFAEKVEPLARSMRELLDGAEEDAKEILTPEQWKQVGPHFDWMRGNADRFERRLAGYREGEVGENENPFDELGSEQGRPGADKVDARVRGARRSVEWEIRRATSWDWSRFLAGAASLFKFDEAQRTKGQAILAAYRKKADAVQTPEWRERVRRTGVMVNLRWQVGEVPKAPWVFHMQQQYEADMRPLRELGQSFYHEILALATPQQRAEVLNDTREMLKKHGLDLTDVDLTQLQDLLN